MAADLAQAEAEVSFNYLGQERVPPGGVIHALPTSARTLRSQRQSRPHLLEIFAGAYDDRLEVHWLYSDAVHRRATIERLAGAHVSALQTMVAQAARADGDAYTPSDFPSARLSDGDLETLLGKLAGRRGGPGQ